MAILQVECFDCLSIFSLRGFVEPEDLVGTQWEGCSKEEMGKLEDEDSFIFEGLDPWSKFDDNPVCLDCGSKRVISY